MKLFLGWKSNKRMTEHQKEMLIKYFGLDRTFLNKVQRIGYTITTIDNFESFEKAENQHKIFFNSDFEKFKELVSIEEQEKQKYIK